MNRNCLRVSAACCALVFACLSVAGDNPPTATPDTAQRPRDDQKPTPSEPVPLSNMELVWSLSIRTKRFPTGVASDPIKGVIYAIDASRADKRLWFTEITLNGKREREFSIKKWNGRARSARLRDKGTRELVTYPPSWVGSGVVA